MKKDLSARAVGSDEIGGRLINSECSEKLDRAHRDGATKRLYVEIFWKDIISHLKHVYSIDTFFSVILH